MNRYLAFIRGVRLKGLEPSRLAAPDPKSGASTNFATSANVVQRYEFSHLSPKYSEEKFWKQCGGMVGLDVWKRTKSRLRRKKTAPTSKLLAESLSHQLLAFSYRGKRKLCIMNYALWIKMWVGFAEKKLRLPQTVGHRKGGKHWKYTCFLGFFEGKGRFFGKKWRR